MATSSKKGGSTAPRRRTQAERSAITRDRVIRAVVDLIAEEGLAHATASRIAKRAGITWGAIAHQFGDKDSLLLAVVEHSFTDMSNSLLDSVGGRPTSAEKRVSMLVDETWHRFNVPSSQAFLEIVLNSHTFSGGEIKSRQEELIVTLSKRIWSDLFDEFGVDPERIDTARKLTFATLLGMSIQTRLGPRKPRFTRELAVLKEQLISMLGLEAEAAS